VWRISWYNKVLYPTFHIAVAGIHHEPFTANAITDDALGVSNWEGSTLAKTTSSSWQARVPSVLTSKLISLAIIT